MNLTEKTEKLKGHIPAYTSKYGTLYIRVRKIVRAKYF